MMIERFAEICEIRNLKVNGYKSTVTVVGEEEESVCEVTDDGGQWYQVSEYTYMGFMLD